MLVRQISNRIASPWRPVRTLASALGPTCAPSPGQYTRASGACRDFGVSVSAEPAPHTAEEAKRTSALTLVHTNATKKTHFVSWAAWWLQEGWSLFVRASERRVGGLPPSARRSLNRTRAMSKPSAKFPMESWASDLVPQDLATAIVANGANAFPQPHPSSPTRPIHSPQSLVGFWPLLQPRSRCRRYYPKLRSPSCKGDGAASLPTCTHCTVTCTHCTHMHTQRPTHSSRC
jgi:hypothetical protein